MSVRPNNQYVSAFKTWSKVASAFTMLVGGLVLIGWISGNDALKSLLPGSIFMKAITALAFLCAGLALWILHAQSAARWLLTVRRLCSILVLLAGLLTLSEYLLGWDLGIDQLIVKETLEFGGVYPGRMAPITAFNFLLLGVSLLHLGEYRRVRGAQIITLPAILLALLAVSGYVYGEHSLYQVGAYTPIALPTAITFLVVGAGVFLIRPDQGWMAVVASDSIAGTMARRLLPAAVLVPILVGWIHLLAESSGRFEEVFVEALAAIAHVVIYTGIVAWSVMTLHRMGLARERAEEEVRRLYVELEGRVLERTAQLAQANEEVERERDHLQALMDNIPDNIYFKDFASRFTRVNQAQARTLGLSKPQEAIGKTDADFFAHQPAAEAHADEQGLLQTGESIVDRRELYPTADGQPRWFSSTKVPLLDQHGKVVGLIGISRDITEHVLAEEVSSEVNLQLSERVGQMSLIIELDEQLQACATVEELYRVTARLVSRLFPGQLGALYAVNSLDKSVKTGATWGTPPLEAQTFELEDCWALRRGRLHRSGGSRSSDVCPHLADPPPAFSVCLPLLAQGETLGVLHLRSGPATNAHDLSAVQLQSGQLAADSVALAWANVRLRESLREQSVTDPLTGLFNRRHMQAALERELRRAARNKKPVGIIMLDIDHFKPVNDAHGHECGDEVLRELGRFLKEHTRGGDIACRFGGEEFVVILPEANLQQSGYRAEQHRLQFNAMRIECNGRLIDAPTLSFGVSAYPEQGTTAEGLLQAADAALYRAKNAGRDRVAVAE